MRDNTQSNAIYAMESAAFSLGHGGRRRAIFMPPPGGAARRYTATRVAAPFALLDTIYTAMQKVLSVAP